VAFLGWTEITVKDLLGLKEGDVIRINRRIDDLLDVNIGGNKKFLGRPGKKGKKKAVKIVRSVTDDDIEEHELI